MEDKNIFIGTNDDNEDRGGNAYDESQTAFYKWLSQHELMAGATCRSYVSAVRSSEKFAEEHGYDPHKLFDVEPSDASVTLKTLLGDIEFTSAHSRYKSALKRFAVYLGLEDYDDSLFESRGVGKEEGHSSTDLPGVITEFLGEKADGILLRSLGDALPEYNIRQIEYAIRQTKYILIADKVYSPEAIFDFDEAADGILGILETLFAVNGDYTSTNQLYKEVKVRLDDFLFYNDDFNSKAAIYDLAEYLFGRIGYKGKHFIFSKGTNIWKEKPDYPMDYSGLLIKYGREHNNVFTREEAIEFLTQLGSATPSQTVSFVINKTGRELFLQFDENKFVLVEALNVDGDFVNNIETQLEALLEGDDYVSMGDIDDFFYSTLPKLPQGVYWTALLIQEFMELYNTPFVSIGAGEGGDTKVIDAAIVRKKSLYKTFADIIWNELSNDYDLPKSFTDEEFRQILLDKGFIRKSEKINTVHKTVKDDFRFLWNDDNSIVTVSKS